MATFQRVAGAVWAIGALCRGFGGTIRAVQTAVRVGIGVLGLGVVILAVLMVLPLLGVPIGFGPFASTAPSPSVTASASAAPSGSAEPSASASADGAVGPTSEPTPSEASWICGLPVTLAASGGSIAHTADIRVGTHPGYDRIVFEYVEDGSPAFEIRTTRPPFTQDASGAPMTVHGSTYMAITLNGATKLGDDGSLTYTGPTDFQPAFPQLVHLTERGDFEALNSWYVGLDGGNCLRAALLTDPSRIVIDVQH